MPGTSANRYFILSGDDGDMNLQLDTKSCIQEDELECAIVKLKKEMVARSYLGAA